MARIRTIKPEFWQNEELASVSLHARLLAIALLNYADDSGCFYANASLVRAACFPFDDDSTNTRRSLDELSNIGYISQKNCSGKLIGKVVNFTVHQRIDRPNKSKLSDMFDQCSESESLVNTDKNDIRRTIDDNSTNTRRSLDEQSSTGKERKGKEREQGKETETDYAQAREAAVDDLEKLDFTVLDNQIEIPEGIQSTPGGAAARPWDDMTVAQCIKELANDWHFTESTCRMYKIDASILPEWMDAYALWKQARDGPTARLSDVRRHFLNWLRGRDLTKPAKVFKDEQSNHKSTKNGAAAQHSGFDLLDAELERIIQDQLGDHPI